MFSVYKHKNTKNGKVYVGYTGKDVSTRFGNHVAKARCGSQLPFHKAIRKYGVDIWETEILTVVDNRDTAKELEKRFIAEHNSNTRGYGYNMTSGGDGGFSKGRVLTEQQRERAIRALRENPPNEEQRLRGIENRRGLKRSSQQRKNISDAMKERNSKGLSESQINALNRLHKKNSGVIRSDDTKLKISNALRGRSFSEEHKQALRKPKTITENAIK